MSTLPQNARHLRDALTATLEGLAVLLDGIRADQLDDPTPCTEYDVAALRRHVVGWLIAFADGFESPSGDCGDPDAVAVAGTGAEQVRAAATRIHAAFEAGALERPLKIGGQGLPGEVAASLVLGEYQVHGWDLARATGQPWSPDADSVEGSIAFFGGMLSPEMRGAGMSFGPEVEVDAERPAIDRLVGVTGRDPAWRA